MLITTALSRSQGDVQTLKGFGLQTQEVRKSESRCWRYVTLAERKVYAARRDWEASDRPWRP